MFHQRILMASLAAAVALACPRWHVVQGDTLLSSFEGDLSSSIGTDWKFYDADDSTPGEQPWPYQFVTTGVTEGTQALEILHFTSWAHGFSLQPANEADRAELIDLFATHDTLEFDVTTPPDTSWRQLFLIVNSSETSWSQVQIDIPANATTHIVVDLAAPDAMDPAKNWKAAAQAGGATATYWEIFFALQGGDNSGSIDVATTFDNFVFVGGGSTTETADFDGDLDVDGADFLAWQRGYGATGLENGDANNDGTVDGLDLTIWKNQFGQPAPGIGAVPEPSSLVPTIIGGALLASSRRRSSSAARQRAPQACE